MNQAFTYIAVILIVGAIAIVGAKSIISLLKTGCESKQVDFTSKVAKFIEEYSDRGTVVSETIAAPCDVKQVCFVSASSMNAGFNDPDPVVMQSVRDASYNIFIKGEFTEPVAKAEKLEVEDGILCINAASSYVRLKFSGTGRTTVVSP